MLVQPQPLRNSMLFHQLQKKVENSQRTTSGSSSSEDAKGVSCEEKRNFLQNAFVPPESYQLPYEERVNTARGRVEKRYPKHSDLRDQRSRWISFSPKSGGLFCRACFSFSTVRNSSFIDKPFSRWKNIWCSGKGIDCHIEKTYHIDAVEKALSFLDPSAHISANISETAKRKQEIGRKTLRTNIEAAIFLAKLGLALRGHIDYGPVPVIENIEGFVGDQDVLGNFRATLQFSALKNGDEKKTMVEASKIENQESKSSQNAQYYAPSIQNEIIACIGDVVLENILGGLKKAGFYSVIADEATDVSWVHQRCVRAVCDTRWVDSHTACVDFCTLFESIVVALADCYLHCEQVAAKAKSLELLKKVADPEFIFSVVLLARCNAVLRCLSKELQTEDTDLSLACDEVLTAQHRFCSWLSGTQGEESGSFQSVSTEAAKHARTATEHLYRTRRTRPLEPEAPEFDNLKAPVYDRFLQSLVDRLEHQFGTHFTLAASISNLLPHRVPSVSYRDIEHVTDFYAESRAITSNKDYIKSQFEHWKAKCSRMPATLCGVREAIRRCRAESTPDIRKLLLIYATIPVSSAASERSFSCMKRIKNYLRNTMTEQRLTGLALAHSHKEVSISTESVLEKMEKRQRRRYMPIVPVPKKPRIAFMDDAEAENPPDPSNDAFLCLSDVSDEE